MIIDMPLVYYKPVPAGDYMDFMRFVEDYFIQQLILAGNYQTETEARAFAAPFLQEKFFKHGKLIPGQSLYDLYNEMHEKIGKLWYTSNFTNYKNERVARVCYIEIFPAYQNKGCGKKIMRWVEAQLVNEPVQKLSLNVFAHNKLALQLYERLRYVIVHRDGGRCEMEKLLAYPID